MNGEPTNGIHAEIRRRLVEGDRDTTAGHIAQCPDCSRFAAGLQLLDETMSATPLPEPPIGAYQRAVQRFRTELAAGRIASPDIGVLEPLPETDAAPAGPPPITLDAARRRRWRRTGGLVAVGIAAAVALIVAFVVIPGPTNHAPPAAAETLRRAAASTRAQHTARFSLDGDITLQLFGQPVTGTLNGSGETEAPNRGALTLTTSLSELPGYSSTGRVISIGSQTWLQEGNGPWQLQPPQPGHVSVIDQALARPDEALDELARIGSNFRELGTATVDGTAVRRIGMTIPGDSFHAFGSSPQQVGRWSVVVDVGKRDLVLRRITVDGRGSVTVAGFNAPFTDHLQTTLHDFGAPVDIRPPR